MTADVVSEMAGHDGATIVVASLGISHQGRARRDQRQTTVRPRKKWGKFALLVGAVQGTLRPPDTRHWCRGAKHRDWPGQGMGARDIITHGPSSFLSS